MGKPSTVKPNPMRYIQRIDTKGHTWKVAIRRANQYVHQYFTDSAYGGTAPALAAAMQWRDQKVAELTNADYVVWRHDVMNCTNSSGIVGVSRHSYIDKRNKRVFKQARWHAHWQNVNGTRSSRSFSVSKYGEEQAKQMAIQAREEGMQDVRRQFQHNQERPK